MATVTILMVFSLEEDSAFSLELDFAELDEDFAELEDVASELEDATTLELEEDFTTLLLDSVAWLEDDATELDEDFAELLDFAEFDEDEISSIDATTLILPVTVFVSP
jgi:hypothetical protein